MKCPMCGGIGLTDLHTPNVGRCTKCNGSGEIKPTNEEYMRFCNTKQLAEELLAWWFDGANTYSQFGLFKWEIDKAKDKITKWLKEKHDAK